MNECGSFLQTSGFIILVGKALAATSIAETRVLHQSCMGYVAGSFLAELYRTV